MLKKKRHAPSCTSEKNLILQDLQQAKSDLDCAYSNFENAVDPDLIDCYIYQLKSAQLRYKFLLERAKKAEYKEGSPRTL